MALGFSKPVQRWFGFPPTQASSPQCPSVRPPILGFLASILVVLDDELLPEVFVPEVTSTGLPDILALPPLPDPPPLTPLVPDMFEAATVVIPAGDVCPVLVALVPLDGVEDVAPLACWIFAWISSR